MNETLARAVKAAGAARRASALARRTQMEQLRTAVHMHTAQNGVRRRQVSAALVRLRESCVTFRMQVRARLRQIGARGIADGPARDTLAERVLGVIARHPDGLPAQEIGNELGVDWRRVLGTLSGLAARGIILQIGQDFYPVEKASRTW